jgi:nicotinamide-nucleotide amidase
VVGLLVEAGSTVAMAESLTGGLATSALVDVPGASAAVLGGVVTYATGQKHRLLGVDADHLRERGAVDPEVAAAMAQGVRALFGSDWGCSTTGVAGPDPQDGVPPGRVYVAVAGGRALALRELSLTGGRAQIRRAAAGAVIDLLLEALLSADRAGVAEGSLQAEGR